MLVRQNNGISEIKPEYETLEEMTLQKLFDKHKSLFAASIFSNQLGMSLALSFDDQNSWEWEWRIRNLFLEKEMQTYRTSTGLTESITLYIPLSRWSYTRKCIIPPSAYKWVKIKLIREKYTNVIFPRAEIMHKEYDKYLKNKYK